MTIKRIYQVWYRREWDDEYVLDSAGPYTEDEAQEYIDRQWEGFDDYQGLTLEVLEERGTDFEIRPVKED